MGTPEEWAGEIFSEDGRWIGTLSCEDGSQMLEALECCTFAGYRVSGVARRPVRPPTGKVISARGPAGIAAARRAFEILMAEV
jgi:hypothetical protein